MACEYKVRENLCSYKKHCTYKYEFGKIVSVDDKDIYGLCDMNIGD